MNKISDLKVGDKVATNNYGIGTVFYIEGDMVQILKTEIKPSGCNYFFDYEIDWQKTTELNKKQMKEFIIECPSGYEIDKENSTFEKIVFKEIGFKFPESVAEIPRDYYFSYTGEIVKYSGGHHITGLSTKERAEAFLALMQLVELRDYVNGDWKADFTSRDIKYCITFNQNEIYKTELISCNCPLHFKSAEIRDQFAEKYKSLIETAKELL